MKHEEMWNELKEWIKSKYIGYPISEYFLNDMDKFLKCEDILSTIKKMKNIELNYKKFDYQSAWERLKKYPETCSGYISYFGSYIIDKMNKIENEFDLEK